MIWYVAVGGAVGSIARYLAGTYIQQRAGLSFPLGTMMVNITGSLLLGFLIRYALGGEAVSPEVRAMLTTGFCGGYTTFSTFSYETVTLLEDGDQTRALMYVGLSVVLALIGTVAGVTLARALLAMQRAS